MPLSTMSPEVQAAFEQARSARTKQVTVDGASVDIPSPYPSPIDWRDQWIYFLLLDRFNNPDGQPSASPFDGMHGGIFQGGTLNGVREQLDYLKQLGVGAIWLSPVLKNRQHNPGTYHGYGIQDFLQIDPRFASAPELAEQELQELVDAAHARGIYVILDIVLNHAGDVFAYVLNDGQRADETDWKDTPYQINWRDADGTARPDWADLPGDPHPDAVIWPAELQRNEYFRRQGRGGEAGGDFASLKEFVTDFQAFETAQGWHYPVRNTLIRAYQYLIARYDLDGFRIDTLKYVEPEFAQVFGNAMREYALSIGKKNFFTFGEVYDNDEQIVRFIGRNTHQDGDLVGVDAALDFPLFFTLPLVAKGMIPPSAISGMFAHRKDLQRGLLSSHGEASRYFVTFLDNHDQRQRFYYSEPGAPLRYADQLTLGLGCLFSLQGIPCIYYGTEQGLHGAGDGDAAVREALWGKPDAFSHEHPFYIMLKQLAAVRSAQPALRYGRQYFRPISGNGAQFGISTFSQGVLAFSRILNNEELVVLANTSTRDGWAGEVIVDLALNPAGATYRALYTNKAQGSPAPSVVVEKPGGQVTIYEIGGAVTHGPARALRVQLQPMEIQILGRG